ncbi:hypothetical protein ACHQM5_029395 [Ranunculus cassubicifolius]
MRSRNSSKHKAGGEMEIDKLNKLKEEPHLSGAYIRSLVKQLSSSRSKNPMNPKPLDCGEGYGLPQTLTKMSENQKPHHPEQPSTQPPPPKKQVRRRLHTSRPYQERLLNMAEARREIVTALKFHRASMKQASEQQQLQSQSKLQPNSLQSSPPPTPQSFHDQIYQTNTTQNNFPRYQENQSISPFSCPPPNPFSWPRSSVSSIPIAENINFPLPNQPLGLNLNFHDFNLDSIPYHYNNDNPSIYSYSSQTSSSSHTMSSIEEEDHSHTHPHSIMNMISPEESQTQMMANPTDSGDTTGGLQTSICDNDMAEIRSLGEQHQVEWNDTVNIVDSAWWFKFASTMDEMKENKGDEEEGFNVFDEVMEFPDWMNANESSFLQQQLDSNSLEDYLEQPALPCMVIEEIDGMDGEWLA